MRKYIDKIDEEQNNYIDKKVYLFTRRNKPEVRYFHPEK